MMFAWSTKTRPWLSPFWEGRLGVVIDVSGKEWLEDSKKSKVLGLRPALALS